MATPARLETQQEHVGPALQALIDRGEIEHDPAQAVVAAALDDVLDDLAARRAPVKRRFGFRRRPGRREEVRGLYIWGTVGRGKTMLMDMFFELVPDPRRRRVHFNDFMADAHRRIAVLRKAGSDHAVEDAAEAMAAEASILCFDEFAVTDIADAMILSRLFGRLFDRQVTLVATSNVAPHDLYNDGLNRALFLPFITELKRHVEVVRLDVGTDYRLDRLEDRQVYFPLADPGFDRLWNALKGASEEAPADVAVGSRTFAAPRTFGGHARFTFAELVEAPLGASDFAALAERFHTLFIEGLPVLSPARRDVTRRFITLIDVLYDKAVRLAVSAAAEPDRLFDTSVGEGRYEGFAFDRTASRLYEMRSSSYLHDVETSSMG